MRSRPSPPTTTGPQPWPTSCTGWRRPDSRQPRCGPSTISSSCGPIGAADHQTVSTRSRRQVRASIVEGTMTSSAEALPPDQPPAEEPLHRALGLTDEEFEAVGKILGRSPNHLELALYAVMWSEHCSYKSSRLHLKRLPTEGPGVLVGPGENAGVNDAGDGIAVAIRIERHNHPSAIEPYQGAATGVGGILRDIFTMGARPLAVMEPALLRAPRRGPAQRWLVEGVVSGISGYGGKVPWACRRWGGSSRSTPATRRTRSSTCSAWARCRSIAWCSALRPVSGTWPCCSDRAPGVTASVASASSLRRASAVTMPARPTTPSAPASRWVTPSRRSG